MKKSVKKLLEYFCDVYGCDGFKDIQIVEEGRKHVILAFKTWDTRVFKLKVTDIKEE